MKRFDWIYSILVRVGAAAPLATYRLFQIPKVFIVLIQ